MELSKRSGGWVKKLLKTQLKQEVERLMKGESVEVGYRSSCGGCKDQTMKDFELFSKLLKALKAQGIIVNTTTVKHKNAYASNNGGFWHSYIYEIGENNT